MRETQKILKSDFSPFEILVNTHDHCPAHYELKTDCGCPLDHLPLESDCKECWDSALSKIAQFEVTIHEYITHPVSDTYTVEVDERDYNEITFDSHDEVKE